MAGRIIQAGPRLSSGGGGGTSGGRTTLAIAAGVVTPDTGFLTNFVVLDASVAIDPPAGSGDEFYLFLDQDSTGLWVPTFDAIYLVDAWRALADLKPDTYSSWHFVFDGTNWRHVGTPIFDVSLT